MATQREQSRQQWTGRGTVEDINSGSLQRIADATESMAESSKLMASNYVRLQEDLESWKKWGKEKQAKLEAAERRITALKGVITKMKRRGK